MKRETNPFKWGVIYKRHANLEKIIMKKNLLFFLAAALIVTFLACFNGALFSQNPASLKRVALKLKWKHQFQFAGYYAAVEKGFYKAAGLDVVLTEPGEDDDCVKDVIEGRAQFGIGTASLVLDHAQGKPIVAVAPIFQHSPTVLIANRKNISRLSDINGKKIIIESQAADITTYLQSAGVQLSKCIIYPHLYSPDPLIKGDVDVISAYLTDEPFMLNSAGTQYTIYSPREAGIDFYGDTLFTTRDFISKEPQAVKKFKHASIEGWMYAFNNTEELVNLIYERYSKRHSLDHLRFEAEQMKKYVIPEVVQIGYSKPERWNQIVNIYKRQNLLPESYSLDSFLYENAGSVVVDYRVWPLTLMSAVAFFISLIAYFFYKLNINLKAEIFQRRTSEENLAKSEERYRTLVENNPSSIAIITVKNREVCYVNPVFENKFLVKKEFVIGKTYEAFPYHTSSINEVFDRIGNYGYVKDHVLVLKDTENKEFWASLSASIIDYEGNPAIFFTIKDISAKIKREEELKKLSSTKDRFLKIIASDLRSSVGTNQSILDYLIKNFGVLKEPEKQDFLYSLKNCVDSTYSLLVNLLEWVSNETGDLQPKPVLVPVALTINEVFELFLERVKHKKLAFQIEVDDKISLACDEGMFKTVIRNVISNAVKFTPSGGAVKVSAGCDPKSSRVKITVADNGVGISRNRLDKLFNINDTFSTQGTDGEKGSGIGLVLCVEFVRKNGGELLVESREGEGTKITIDLPAA